MQVLSNAAQRGGMETFLPLAAPASSRVTAVIMVPVDETTRKRAGPSAVVEMVWFDDNPGFEKIGPGYGD